MCRVFQGLVCALLHLILCCVGACAPRADAPRPLVELPSSAPPAVASQQQLRYPETKRSDHVDEYHGVTIVDPYRWLEGLDSPDTRAWIAAQNRVTFDYLANIPIRESIRRRATQLWNFERYGVPFREGHRYFFTKNDGLQNHNVLYMVDAPSDTPRVVLDPNTFSSDGTIALNGMAVSPSGELLAYALSNSGSDWQEWKIRDVKSGTDRADHLLWSKFSRAEWTKDSQGFFYCRYDEPSPGQALAQLNYFQKLYYHRVGTPQSSDVLVYERRDQKDWEFDPIVTEDGKYLVMEVSIGTDPKTMVFYRKLRKGQHNGMAAKMTELLPLFDAKYVFLGNAGPIFWFRTDLEAPRGKIVAIDTRKPGREHWKTVVAQAPEALRTVSVVGDRFVAVYLEHAHSHVKVFRLDGSLERELELPGIGTVQGFPGKQSDRETFYAFESFTRPSTIYRYDVASGKSEVFRTPKLAFDPLAYETRQVFVASKDGTKVPMFITHKRGLQPDGQLPTYLFGYGGFNVAMTPSFSVANLVWMEMGGVYALANLRGGGEYGEQWHRAGTKENKQNVFDDFIAAAQWLIANRWTSPQRLAIGGRSNGGLLVGAVITQRPELFRAALPAVGVMDMLRFHKFTIGWAWVSDYGSADDPAMFHVLRAYSPYHNIKPGTRYPATLVTTADHDDRVVPGHSYKFAAALQAAQAGGAPVLIRIDVKAGHGAGKPTTKLIDEWTDSWAFLVHELGMQVDTTAYSTQQSLLSKALQYKASNLPFRVHP